MAGSTEISAKFAALFGAKEHHEFSFSDFSHKRQTIVALQVAGSQDAVDRLIDDKLLPLRAEAGLKKSDISFAAVQPEVGGIVDREYKPGQLIVTITGDPEAVLERLKPVEGKLKAFVRETAQTQGSDAGKASPRNEYAALLDGFAAAPQIDTSGTLKAFRTGTPADEIDHKNLLKGI